MVEHLSGLRKIHPKACPPCELSVVHRRLHRSSVVLRISPIHQVACQQFSMRARLRAWDAAWTPNGEVIFRPTIRGATG